jgi:hypothetical protein
VKFEEEEGVDTRMHPSSHSLTRVIYLWTNFQHDV